MTWCRCGRWARGKEVEQESKIDKSSVNSNDVDKNKRRSIIGCKRAAVPDTKHQNLSANPFSIAGLRRETFHST